MQTIRVSRKRSGERARHGFRLRERWGKWRITAEFLIADDHPLVRGALRQAVAGAVPDAVISECGDMDELSAALGKGQGDATSSCSTSPCPACAAFPASCTCGRSIPTLPVIVVSANEDRAVIRRCIDFGASGYHPQDDRHRGDARGHPHRAGGRDVDAAGRRPRRARRTRRRPTSCAASRP